MTQRQAQLIDNRTYLIKKFYEFRDKNEELADEILAKYSTVMPCGVILRLAYIPDALLEIIISELEEAIKE